MSKLLSNKYSLSLIVLTLVSLFLIIGTSFNEAGSDNSVSTQVSAANNLNKKSGAHGAYDPHSSLTPEKHIQVALQHKQEGRMPEAMRTLSMAIMQHSGYKDLYAIRGSLYLEQGKPTEALIDFEKGLKIAPKDSALLTNRAQVYRQFGQIEQALADLNRALDVQPDLVAARFNRGAIYYSSGDFELALVDFNQCVAINPHSEAPYFNRASTKYALNDIAGAREDLERFIQLSQNEEWRSTARELLERWNADDNAV